VFWGMAHAKLGQPGAGKMPDGTSNRPDSTSSSSGTQRARACRVEDE